MASPYSPMNLAQKLGSPSTIDFLLGGNRVTYNNLEAQLTKGLGAPKWPQKVSNTTKASRVQWPESNKLTNFHFHESSWREQTDATKCNGKKTRSAQVLHAQIPPKATNACGGRREEEQRRTQQMELQDLDLLSLFPLNGGKNHGGIERNPISRRSTMGGFFLLKSLSLWGRRGPFIGPHEIELL